MKRLMIGCFAAVFLAANWTAFAQTSTADGPQFTGTSLAMPANYREWVFLASGLGMTYDPNGARPNARQNFTNVFVNPPAYREFLKSGAWPNGTMLMLEIRASESEGSINKGGSYQTGVVGMEVHVKDARFSDGGWAFYNFGSRDGLLKSAEPIPAPRVNECIECHTKNGAVDRTFVQFYPTLIETAKRMGTFRQ